MPAPHLHTFYQYTFLQHVPQHYALLLTLEEAPRRHQQYDEHRGPITAALLICYLADESDLTAPATVDGRAHLLPFDANAGGIVAIHAPIAEAAHRGLWSFGQYCPRIGLAEQDQCGYVLTRTHSARAPSYSAPTVRTPLLLLVSATTGISPSRRPCIGAF